MAAASAASRRWAAALARIALRSRAPLFLAPRGLFRKIARISRRGMVASAWRISENGIWTASIAASKAQQRRGGSWRRRGGGSAKIGGVTESA
jgi:hypothetical protein